MTRLYICDSAEDIEHWDGRAGTVKDQVGRCTGGCLDTVMPRQTSDKIR